MVKFMKVSLKKIRKTILVGLTHKIALPMLKLVRRPNEFTYSEDELQSFQAGTLGKDLIIFYHCNFLEKYMMIPSARNKPILPISNA